MNSGVKTNTYETNAVVNVCEEGEDGESVKKRKLELKTRRKGKGSHDDNGNWRQEPANKFASCVAHLGDNQLAANVGKDDANKEGEATWVSLQDVCR